MIESAMETEDGTTINIVLDGRHLSVPKNTENGHYNMILEWVENGGVIEPYPD